MDYHTLLHDETFFSYLRKIDKDLADQVQQGGCKKCKSVLHHADYLRSQGFGITEDSDKESRRRYSLCCAADGCRARNTPASVQFMRGKCFVSVVIVLMTAMQHGITADRQKKIAQELGIARQTLHRWRFWWKEIFTQSPGWRSWKSQSHVECSADLPDALLARFQSVATHPIHALILMCAVMGALHLSDLTPIFTLVQTHITASGFPQTWCHDEKSEGR